MTRKDGAASLRSCTKERRHIYIYIYRHPSTRNSNMTEGGGGAKKGKEHREKKNTLTIRRRNVTYRHLRNINIYEPLPANGMNAPAFACIHAPPRGSPQKLHRPFVNTRVDFFFLFFSFSFSFFFFSFFQTCATRLFPSRVSRNLRPFSTIFSINATDTRNLFLESKLFDFSISKRDSLRISA